MLSVNNFFFFFYNLQIYNVLCIHIFTVYLFNSHNSVDEYKYPKGDTLA